MESNTVFYLYGKVLKKDKQAKKLFIAEHKARFPQSHLHKLNCGFDKDQLHIMFLNLYK